MASKHESLLKYNNPNLVSTQLQGKKAGKSISKTSKNLSFGGAGSISGSAEKQAKTKAERDQDYLNSILPPFEYMENGSLWIKYVSPQPATQVDVINLQEQLDLELHRKQAREHGICQVREELFK